MKYSGSLNRTNLPTVGSLTTKTTPPGVSWRLTIKSERSLGQVADILLVTTNQTPARPSERGWPCRFRVTALRIMITAALVAGLAFIPILSVALIARLTLIAQLAGRIAGGN